MSYGTRVVASAPTSDPYGQRYKGIWICLDLLKTALAGNYVNFGVFELYGDPALKVPTQHMESACSCRFCAYAVLKIVESEESPWMCGHVQGILRG